MTQLWSLKTPPPGEMTEDGTLPWYGVYTSLDTKSMNPAIGRA